MSVAASDSTSSKNLNALPTRKAAPTDASLAAVKDSPSVTRPRKGSAVIRPSGKSPQNKRAIKKENLASPTPTDRKLATAPLNSRETKKRFSVRINAQQFLEETTRQERSHLTRELLVAIRAALEEGSAVHLFSLGLLHSRRMVRKQQHQVGGSLMVVEAEQQEICFERCAELSSEHHQQFSSIVGMAELAFRIQSHLTLFTGWSERETRRFLRGFCKHVTTQLVEQGYSNAFQPLGTLYAITPGRDELRATHSADSVSPALISGAIDGADIFFRSNPLRTERTTLQGIFPTPTVNNAHEPFAAVTNAPCWQGSLSLIPPLVALGYSREALLAGLAPEALEIQLALFESPLNKELLHLVSDGLRHKGCTTPIPNSNGSQTVPVGTEAVITLRRKDLLEGEGDSSILNPLQHGWVEAALVHFWMLLQSSRSGHVEAGEGVLIEDPNKPSGTQSTRKNDHSFHSYCATEFASLPLVYHSTQGAFQYRGFVALTQKESLWAKRHFDFLYAYMKRRGYHQTLLPTRPSLDVPFCQ